MDTLALLRDILEPQPGERILDVGCGIGLSTASLVEAGARVTGIDVVPALLEQARIACPRANFLEADLLGYQPAKPFDALFAHATLHWIRPPKDAAWRLLHCLRPGGRMAASLGGAVEAARELEAYYSPSPQEYEKVLKKAGFTEIETGLAQEGALIVAARRPG